MARPPSTQPPLQRAWNIISALLGAIGTAGMIDDIVAWSKFINAVIDGYQSIIHPLLAPVVDLLGLGNWAKDYLFVGIMVSSARVRAIYNNLHGRWLIDISKFRWWHIWAPHKLAALFIGLLAALFWPLTALAFLPDRILKPDPDNHFQQQVSKDQNQWLMVYVLLLIFLFATNAGLMSLIKA